MKKILIIILLIALSGTAYLIINSRDTHSKSTESKKQLEVLLSKPDDEKKYNYILLDDYENNRKKKSAGIDFISGIKKNRKNPYNNISSKAIATGVSNMQEDYSSDSSDVMVLARLIESEAENQSYIGKLAVGSVVMNRCKINGNTVSQTIYASGQFDGVNTALFNKEPSSEDIRAAQQVLAGANMLQNAYYYANLKLCDPEFAKEDKFITRIGDHWFFRR